MRDQKYWLLRLAEIQSQIVLVYRPTIEHGWSNRCLYGGEDYDPHRTYNHRSVLDNEVIIEYDTEDVDYNRELANKVCRRLSDNNIGYSKWKSGNKSTHVHTIIRTGAVKDRGLLKRCFARWLCRDQPLPDLQLLGANHLIRAECSAHEKTGNRKTLLSCTPGYPHVSYIPEPVWEEYRAEFRKKATRKLVRNSTMLKEHPGIKYLLTTHEFKETNDGHKRALFILIHVLKEEYRERREELIEFLNSWYSYSGGKDMTREQITRLVDYHWNRTYSLHNYLNLFLEELGRKDLVEDKHDRTICN